MTTDAQALIIELDSVLSRAPAPAAWRGKILRRVTDLFLVDAEAYSDDQVSVFDDVISHLIAKADRRLLVELSNRLAQAKSAPLNVVGTLARHTDMLIAGPLLEKSSVLTDADLVEIADKDRRDPALLSLIAARAQLSEALTDILIKRGNAALVRRIIDRPDAPISEASFARMVTSVEKDKDLAGAIAKRPDLPAELRPWLDAALVGKDRVLLVFDENGLGLTDGFLDHTTFHCWGTGDYTNGVGEDHGWCVGTGPIGDQIVSNVANPQHQLGAKTLSGTDTWTTGTGKLAGVSGGGTYDCDPGLFKTAADGTYAITCIVKGSYKLP